MSHLRLSSLSRNSPQDQQTSPSNSPQTTRPHRQLGSIGGRAGPGYSPYARRVASRAVLASSGAQEGDEPASAFDDDEAATSPATIRQSTGLFGKVRSLPRRLLGALTRSSSSRTLTSSQSLADVRAQVDVEVQRERAAQNGAGNGAGGGMTRSKTGHNLVGAAQRLQHSAVLNGGGLTSSSSMSALSSLASPSVPSQYQQPRSAHSTLILPTSATSSSGSGLNGAPGGSTPSFLTAANLGRHSRAASPAPSSASFVNGGNRHRSPSPLRNGLAGSMSAFNLSQIPASPSISAFQNHHHHPTLGNNVVSNPFGLTSRSPFSAPTRRGGNASPTSASSFGGARSVSSTYGAPNGASQGHPLFPYSPALPRGQSPSLLSHSQSMREGLSSLAAPVASASTTGSILGQKRPRGSPLNPTFMEAESEGGRGEENGAERARKKQMVWDPVRGLLSRERLEREQERDAPPLPKNQAERILEVLEGMGRTPAGEAKRGSVRSKVAVPAPSASLSSARLPRSSTTPSLSTTPYGARGASLPSTSAASAAAPEKGLQAVLRAREARRKALLEQERDEREREEKEDRERERVRAGKRDKRRRQISELGSDEEELDARSFQDEDMEEEIVSPRRVTRSAAKSKPTSSKANGTKSSKATLEPPTPSGGARRSTRTSTRAGASKSPSPAPPATKKSKGKSRATSSDAEDAPMSPTSARSPSPPPPTAASAVPPVPAMPKISFPTPSSFPSTTASTLPTGRSSLRPGKSHSSRTHTASSKVFSAREEDLPPLDDSVLKGMQFKVPAGFSFGAPAATTATVAEKKDGAEEKKNESSSLLSRIGAPAPTTAAPSTTPSFSFPTAKKDTNDAPKPSVPSFSFAAPASNEKKDDSTSTKPPAFSFSAPSTSSTAAAKPAAGGFSFATPLATSTPPSSTTASSDGAAKPNFFGAVLAEKKDVTAPVVAVPSFSFGAAPTPAAAPAKVEEVKKADAGVNPFAAFGKPVSEIVKAAEGGAEKVEEKKEESVAKPAFSFGAIEKKDTPVAAPVFGFTAKPAADSTASAASPFSFSSSTAAKTADKPAPTPSFSFGAASSTGAASSPAPAFSFTSTPATPKAAEDKKEPTPAPAFGLAAKASSVVDDAGDSGMEDEDEPAIKPAPTPAAAPVPSPSFNFNANSSAAPSPFGATSSAPSFVFGAAPSTEKKDAPASPFGAPATSSSTSLFGTNTTSTAPKLDFSFGASPSPAPQSPAAITPSFNFNSTSSAAPFGQPAPTFGAPPAPTASALPSFAFGQPASAPSSIPGSPAPAFSFGQPSSTAMGQSLSATSSIGSNAPFAFGSQPTTPAATGSSGFVFGGAAGAGGAAPSQFAFGSGAASPAAAPGAFSFGAAPTGAAPAAGGGLFNIGSGSGAEESKAPGGRTIRPLRRPKR